MFIVTYIYTVSILKNTIGFNRSTSFWSIQFICFCLNTFQDTSIALIKTGQFKLLRMLLEPVEFQPLKPLLLLHGWSYCHSCQTAKQLLDALWSEEVIIIYKSKNQNSLKMRSQLIVKEFNINYHLAESYFSLFITI